MLRVVGSFWPTVLRPSVPKRLTGFKLYATSANKCQHRCAIMQTDASCWAETMLPVVGQQCCVRMHGASVHCQLGDETNTYIINIFLLNHFFFYTILIKVNQCQFLLKFPSHTGSKLVRHHFFHSCFGGQRVLVL